MPKSKEGFVPIADERSRSHVAKMLIRMAGEADTDRWTAMRAALWPDMTAAAHREDIAALRAKSGDRLAAFLALDDRGGAAGFAEALVRHDYVNGCETSPVAFVEGIYVHPEQRGKHIGRALVAAVEAWGRAKGCRELGSDALLDNHDSHAFHAALGFEETGRVIFFRKRL